MLINCLPHIVLYTFPTYCNQLHRKQVDENGKALLGCLQDYQKMLTYEVGSLLIYFSNMDYNLNDIPLINDTTWNAVMVGFYGCICFNNNKYNKKRDYYNKKGKRKIGIYLHLS